MTVENWIALIAVLLTMLALLGGFALISVKAVATFAFKTGEMVTEVQGLRNDVTRAIGEISNHIQLTGNKILEHEEKFHPRE